MAEPNSQEALGVEEAVGYYKQLAVVPGDQAFFTAKESGCPLTK